LSYGVSSAALAVEDRAGIHLDAWVVGMILSGAAIGGAIVASRAPIFISTNDSELCERLFLAGAGIYLGTFCWPATLTTASYSYSYASHTSVE